MLERGFCHGKNEGGGKCEFFRVFFSIKEKQFKQEGGEEKKARDSQSPLPRVLHHRPQAPPDRPEPLRQGRRRRPAGLALPGRADERDEVAERRGLLRRLRFGFFGTFDLDVDDGLDRKRKKADAVDEAAEAVFSEALDAACVEDRVLRDREGHVLGCCW